MSDEYVEVLYILIKISIKKKSPIYTSTLIERVVHKILASWLFMKNSEKLETYWMSNK